MELNVFLLRIPGVLCLPPRNCYQAYFLNSKLRRKSLSKNIHNDIGNKHLSKVPSELIYQKVIGFLTELIKVFFSKVTKFFSNLQQVRFISRGWAQTPNLLSTSFSESYTFCRIRGALMWPHYNLHIKQIYLPPSPLWPSRNYFVVFLYILLNRTHPF